MLEHALAVRTWLVEQGLDAGPLSVAGRMRRQGLTAPSRATLARVFAAAGVYKPEPRKRPRAANRRFVYPTSNCCWQIDAFAWSLADGTPVAIHQVVDDHSRLAVATLVRFLSVEERGQSRIYFIRPILSVGRDRGRAVVEALRTDPVFGKEATALLKKRR